MNSRSIAKLLSGLLFARSPWKSRSLCAFVPSESVPMSRRDPIEREARGREYKASVTSLLVQRSNQESTPKSERPRFYSLWTRPPRIRYRFRFSYAQKPKTPCENLVPLVEAVNDFVGEVGKQAGLTKSSAEGRARDVKNFRGASFSFGPFSFGRAKENGQECQPYSRSLEVSSPSRQLT